MVILYNKIELFIQIYGYSLVTTA